MDSLNIRTYIMLFDVMYQNKMAIEALAERYGLTFSQLTVLYQLYKEGSIMGEVAKRMHCDASNITGIVDKLEAQGMLERIASAHDRRAKQLHITTYGRQLDRKSVV